MTRLHTSAPVRSRPATSGPGPRRNEKCVAASPLKEAFMLNRTPSSHSTFFRLTPTFLTTTAQSYRVDRGFGRCVGLTANSRVTRCTIALAVYVALQLGSVVLGTAISH